MKISHKLLLLSSFVFVVVTFVSGSENWPAWRGPFAHGSSADGSYPAKWGETENVVWKAVLPGKGCSTPITWDKRIYLTCAAEGQDAVLGFGWNGEPLWQAKLGPERKGKHRNGSGSNPSLVTDGERLYALFKSGRLAALNLAGKTLWEVDLKPYGRDNLYWDFGTSPVLAGGHLVVALMRNGNSWLLAFDPASGKVNWKRERDYQTPREGDHSYATPIVVKRGGKESLLVWGAERLTSHDLSDGSILWSSAGFNPKKKNNWVVVGSHVVVGDVAVVPYGRGAHLAGIRLGGKGDVTKTHRLWTRDGIGCFVPTPAAAGGKLYVLRDRGEVHCIDPKSGKTLWDGAFPRSSSSYYGSPTVAGGKLYAPREDGVVLVADVSGDVFRFLSENDMGERVIASPVPVADRLFVRGEKHLFCLGK